MYLQDMEIFLPFHSKNLARTVLHLFALRLRTCLPRQPSNILHQLGSERIWKASSEGHGEALILADSRGVSRRGPRKCRNDRSEAGNGLPPEPAEAL